jgi:uncharacterized secreted protein with C-terminal beta-propeller domain
MAGRWKFHHLAAGPQLAHVCLQGTGKTMRNLLLLGALATATAVVGGCSGDKNAKQPWGVTRATLRKAQSCGDLEASLKRDALQKMNKYFDAQIEMMQHYDDQVFGAGGSSKDSAAPGAPQGEASNAGSDRAASHSETNTQVKGVDEADIVKTDGKYIYLLHGQTFQVLSAWPADQLAGATSTPIEGEPDEMYVADGRVVVYSRVNGDPIYNGSGVKPRSRYYDAYYGGGRGAPAIDCAGPGCGGGWYQNPLTKITVLTLDGAKTTVQREVYFEGHYQSSRRIGAKVRTVLGGGAYGPPVKYYPEYQNGQGYPTTKEGWIQVYEQLRAENTAVIKASTVKDWLPYSFSKEAGAYVARLTACEDYYLPTEGSTEYGLTQIAAIDLDQPQSPAKQAAIVGAIDTIYSSKDAMYLAARAWLPPNSDIWGPGVSVGGGGVAVGSTRIRHHNGTSSWTGSISTTYTHVHKFDLNVDPSVPVYEASGTVVGQILNQFSLDEKDRVLRMSTTEQRYTNDGKNNVSATTVNRVFALASQNGELKVIGDVGELAPGERIYSTRFVGDRGYVVTFRQVDPLFVIDLKNPAAPAVLGQLKIPGFSEYMHPLDEGHLLTIGRDVDETTNRRGGLALQIFDVTNAVSPKLVHKHVFDPSEWGYSEASQNHKAFTYFADRKLLSFPFYAYSDGGMRSSAELFKIDIAAGIQKVGSVDHSSLMQQNPQGYCRGYFSPYVRRSVFLDNVLFSFSYGGVLANDTANLAQIAKLPLANPTLDGYSGCY